MSLYGALAYNYEKVAAGTAEILSGNRMISDRLGLPSEDILTPFTKGILALPNQMHFFNIIDFFNHWQVK